MKAASGLLGDVLAVDGHDRQTRATTASLLLIRATSVSDGCSLYTNGWSGIFQSSPLLAWALDLNPVVEYSNLNICWDAVVAMQHRVRDDLVKRNFRVGGARLTAEQRCHGS